MLSILFSTQAKKAWGGLIAAVAGTAAAKYGLDLSGCSSAVGNVGAGILDLAIPGLATMLTVFRLKNRPV